ncbi:MAG: replication-associated recombination protein A [Thermomicrobiales bacterium]
MFGEAAQSTNTSFGPLAARMRPRSLDEFVGQDEILKPGSVIRNMIDRDRLSSLIFWGPPGVGKTTLARILATDSSAEFVQLSAVSSGVADLRKAVAEARDRQAMLNRRTVLFIDEIHRFNKAQQDAILPYVEDGTITLIGATTENPSFEVNAPLLSRARVVVLKPLEDIHIEEIVKTALEDKERGLGNENLSIESDALRMLVDLANGDARFALTSLDMASVSAEPGGEITTEMVAGATQRRAMVYDKSGEGHFDTISALHKSMRDSDANAAVYWLARMLEAGDDPLYVARRLVRFASEDVGLADPQALTITMSAQQAAHFIGMPESALALTQAVIYLSLAPKSNAVYRAYGDAREDVHATRNDPVPLHLRNAVTGLMRGLGYGRGYQYAHDHEDAMTSQTNLPENLNDREYYRPTGRGFESTLSDRMGRIREMKRSRRSSDDGGASGKEVKKSSKE